MARTGKFGISALIDEIKREEEKQAAISKEWPLGDERREWHRAISTGLAIAADIAESFVIGRRNARIDKEGRQ